MCTFVLCGRKPLSLPSSTILFARSFMHSSLLLFLAICLLPACLITIWRARQKRKTKDYEREEVSPTKPEHHTPIAQTYDQPQFLQAVRFSHESYPLIYVPQSGTAPQRPRFRKRAYPQGVTEQTLKRALYRHLVIHRSGLLRRFTYSQISSNAYIPTSSTARAYEPDITIIAELGDQRLLLDIEIDEPVRREHRRTDALHPRTRRRPRYAPDQSRLARTSLLGDAGTP